MNRRIVLLATLACAFAPACRSTPAAPPAAGASAAQTATGCTLVLIKTGPRSGQLPQADNERAFAGHFANMTRMAEAHELLVAGPYGDKRHDSALRGVFVLASADRAQAERWAATDPTTQAGVFTLEFHALATDAPLAAAAERDLAKRAKLAAQGKTPAPGDSVRPYVLLTAEHADLAERELGALRSAEGGVFLLGRLDGTRALAVLDAENLAQAHERFAPQLQNIGAYALDEWYASAELAGMVD